VKRYRLSHKYDDHTMPIRRGPYFPLKINIEKTYKKVKRKLQVIETENYKRLF